MTQTGDPDDYSYDLAHEGVPEAAARPVDAGGAPVTTETPAERDGDYSYDLAHDIPPAER
jgi:hypothetical protein